jgi:hypothetical protein
LKLLHAGIIYPVLYNEWVSPVQVVPKKGGMTIVKNEKNELIPQRTVTRWRIRIDYRKLNTATKKDHFFCPSLIKCWSDWQITLSFIFLMGIQVITKYRSILMIKTKPHLHVHMELMLIVECLLDYVML